MRILDLSNLTTPFDASNRPLASWRDWKLRTEPLYKMRESEAVSQNTKVDHRSKSDLIIKANRKTARRSKNIISSSSCFKSYHPLQSPLLKQFASIKDVPTGYLLHILYCCKGIVGINLSNLPLAIDYRVESLKYKSIYLDKQQFVSDLPKSYFEPYEVSALSVMDLFKAMVMLENLQILTIINVTWVTREVIGEFLRDSAAIHTQSLKSIDLQKSGMARNLPWAILGTPADIQCALKF